MIYRSEVWEDQVNPLNDWWEGFAPSQEEAEAMAAGYDFANPKAWLEVSSLAYIYASIHE